MNDAQRVEFEANGYIVIPDCLTSEQVADLNAVYDLRLDGNKFGQQHEVVPTTDRHGAWGWPRVYCR